MSGRQITLGSVVLGLLIAVFMTIAGNAEARAPQGERVRVGTFRRADLLVAYYGSTVHDQALRDLIRQRDEAKAAGQEDKVKELEARGSAMQDFAHKQLAGEAMLTNVLEHLKPKFPAVAGEAKVVLIVEQPLFHDATVELVDITEPLVKQFEPAKKPNKPERNAP